MQNYLRLLRYARRQRSVFSLIFALTIIAAGLSAVQPWPVKVLLDRLQQAQAGLAKTAQPLSPGLLAVIVAAGLLLFMLNAAVDASLSWRWTASGRRMVYELAEDLFARLQRRSLLFHKRNTVGDSLSRVTVDCWSVYQITDALVFSPLHALLSMGAMIFLMAQLDLRLTLLALANLLVNYFLSVNSARFIAPLLGAGVLETLLMVAFHRDVAQFLAMLLVTTTVLAVSLAIVYAIDRFRPSAPGVEGSTDAGTPTVQVSNSS